MLPSVPNNTEDRPAQSKSVRQKLGGGVNLNGNIAFSTRGSKLDQERYKYVYQVYL